MGIGVANVALMTSTLVIRPVSLSNIASWHQSALISSKVQSFWTLPLPARLAAIGGSLIPNGRLEAAIRAIERRNSMIHEGSEDHEADAEHVWCLLDVVRMLATDVRPKLGKLLDWNILYEEE